MHAFVEECVLTTWHTQRELAEKYGDDFAYQIAQGNGLEKKFCEEQNTWVYKVVQRQWTMTELSRVAPRPDY